MASAIGCGAFITGTGTGVGKTFVTMRLCELLRASGGQPIALKPIETGVDEVAEDAHSLARASGRSADAWTEGFYRANLPVAPWAATLAGETAPDLDGLVRAVRRVLEEAPDDAIALVEGAGGPLVPLNETKTVADFCAALGLPAVLVARDCLGTLSHTLSAYESLRAREIRILAVVLNRFGDADASQEHNQKILAKLLPVPVVNTETLFSIVALLRDQECEKERSCR